MKTIEEMKSVVIAYSNQHIPHYGDCMTIGKIEFTRSTVTKRNFAISFLDENGDSTTIWLAETIAATDARWQLFYSVLGLETRDALAPYKSENERLQSAWMVEKARNAALVAALEVVKYGCEFGNQSLGCQKLPDGKGYSAVIGSPYEFVCNTLQAYKKGGANG